MKKELSELFDDVYTAANEIELGAHPLAGATRSSDAWTAFNDAMNALGEFVNTGLVTVICQNDFPVAVTLDHAAALQRKKEQTDPNEGIFIHLHQFPLS